MRKGTVRGGVFGAWEGDDRPNWDLNRTIEACESADANLDRQGLNSAPKFREARLRRDTRYIRTWVLGCHFSWLNPR